MADECGRNVTATTHGRQRWKSQIGVAEEFPAARLGTFPAPHWRLVTSYLYSDAEILDAPQQRELEGNRLAQVPESQGSMTLEWSDPRWFSVSVMGRFVDDQFEDDLNSLELGTAVVVDFALLVPVGPRLAAFLRAENIFDDEVEAGRTADGLLTLGTPFLLHAGLRVNLARGGS